MSTEAVSFRPGTLGRIENDVPEPGMAQITLARSAQRLTSRLTGNRTAIFRFREGAPIAGINSFRINVAIVDAGGTARLIFDTRRSAETWRRILRDAGVTFIRQENENAPNQRPTPENGHGRGDQRSAGGAACPP